MSAMLAPSRGPRNCSVEPARRMEKIGTGLNVYRLAPSKSGLYSPPAPTMTVQLPDTGGRKGNSKGGAGNVIAVWAATGPGKAAIAPAAASNRPERAWRATLAIQERKQAWTAWLIEVPGLPSIFLEGSVRVGRSDKVSRQRCPKIAPRLRQGRSAGSGPLRQVRPEGTVATPHDRSTAVFSEN